MKIDVNDQIFGKGWFAGVIIGSLISIFLSSCSMGGGTIGTGITSYGSNSQTGLISFSIEGNVKDQSGKLIYNASVSIFSSEGEGRAITNRKGRYLIPVAFTGGEEVEIIVRKDSSLWSCKKFISPAGQDFVRVDLTTSSGARLICN